MTIRTAVSERMRVPLRSRPYSIPKNITVISIKPIDDIYLDSIPAHDEVCSIVWRNNKRQVKFINRACPYHGRTQCIVEPAH